MGLVSVGPTFQALPFQKWNGVASGSPYNPYLVVPPRLYNMGWANVTLPGTGSAAPVFYSSFMTSGLLPRAATTHSVGFGPPTFGGYYEPYYGGFDPGGDFTAPSFTPGSGAAQQQIASPVTYSVAAVIDSYYYPGNILVRWDYDVSTGLCYQASTYGTGLGTLFAAGNKTAQDPNGGATWTYGVYLDVFLGGVVQVDPISMTAIASSVIRPQKYIGYTNGATATSVFAIDSAHDIILADWGNLGNGRARLYRYGSGQRIADLTFPCTSADVVSAIMDGQFIYIIDAHRWIHIYDYVGNYLNSLLNDTYSPGVQVTYCFDATYHCLRATPFPLCAVDGSATAVPVGVQPVAVSERLTAPIPRKVARKNRAGSLWSHLSGGGHEAKAGQFGIWSGAAAGQVLSDTDGDILLPYTPPATGSVSPTVTVNT